MKAKTNIKFNGEKIGRITLSIAKKLRCKCADIYVSDDLTHILRHKKEIESVGFTAYDYVRFIAKNFNQIRKGSCESFLLVVYNETISHVAAIKMNYCTKKGIWEVATAQPRRKSEIDKKEMLWCDCPHHK